MKYLIKIILICLLLIIVFSEIVFAQTDTIYATVEGDSVTIHNDQAHRNCASLFRFDVQQENFLVTVFEVDTAGEWANCLCYFNLSVKAGPFLLGDYTVDIYETNVFTGDTTFIGSTNFTIQNSGSGENMLTLSQFQSDCYTIIDVDPTTETTPDKFTVSELYPNPFNPVTNIDFSIPITGNVELNVYNLLGEKVASLINENLYAGNHSVSWDGIDQPSGIYLVRLKYKDFNNIQKAILIK